jgi:hypothetical protein
MIVYMYNQSPEMHMNKREARKLLI